VAQFEVGRIHEQGELGVSVDSGKAASWFKRASENEDKEARGDLEQSLALADTNNLVCLKELDQLVGLTSVKNEVRTLSNLSTLGESISATKERPHLFTERIQPPQG
jgi:hypothetical protein